MENTTVVSKYKVVNQAIGSNGLVPAYTTPYSL